MPTPTTSQEFARYRHKVTLQRKTVTKNELAAPVTVWEDLKSFFGFLKQISGKEYVFQKQLTESTTHTLECRWLGNDITPDVKDRIVWNGSTYNIESVNNENNMNAKYLITLIEDLKKKGGQ